VSVDLPKPVEQCFDVAAAIAVVMSDGGEWLDHGTPVDAPALRRYLDGIGTQTAGLSQDEPERVTVHRGRIDWRHHEIEMRAEQAQVNVAGVLVMSRDDRGGTTHVAARLRVRARRVHYRVLAFLGGPFIRSFTRRWIRRHQDEWSATVMAASPLPVLSHRDADWRFEPTRRLRTP
jgi:hypothetical protein